MIVALQRVSPFAVVPTKGTKESACYDLHASEQVLLDVGDVKWVSTGWNIEVPSGYFLDIRPRSGLAGFGITVNNAPGTIDEDYRGELKIVLVNHGVLPHTVIVGDRIAQCTLLPVVSTAFMEFSELTQTQRGQQGFGSTGR